MRSMHVLLIKDESGYLTDQLRDLKSSTLKVLKEARRCELVLTVPFSFPSSARENSQNFTEPLHFCLSYFPSKERK